MHGSPNVLLFYVHTTLLLTHIFFASQQRKIRKAGTLFVSCSHLAKFAQLMLCFMHISFWSLFDATWVHCGEKSYKLRKNILKISYLFEYSSIWDNKIGTFYILNHSSTPTIVICVQKRWMILDSNYPLDIFNGS